MLRKVWIFGLAAILGGCGDSDDESNESNESGSEGSSAPMLTEASAETRALWTDISGYESWSQFPEATELTQSATHSNMWVRSFYNETVGTAMEEGTVPLADGAIIVKENYMNKDDPAPMALTVMSKMGGEWYWVQGTPDGQVFVGPDGGAMEGKNVGMCVMCHSAAQANDYVMSHAF
jgi:hypothetical protein